MTVITFYYLSSFSSLLWVLLLHLHNTDDGGFCWCSLTRAALAFFGEEGFSLDSEV